MKNIKQGKKTLAGKLRWDLFDPCLVYVLYNVLLC